MVPLRGFTQSFPAYPLLVWTCSSQAHAKPPPPSAPNNRNRIPWPLNTPIKLVLYFRHWPSPLGGSEVVRLILWLLFLYGYGVGIMSSFTLSLPSYPSAVIAVGAHSACHPSFHFAFL